MIDTKYVRHVVNQPPRGISAGGLVSFYGALAEQVRPPGLTASLDPERSRLWRLCPGCRRVAGRGDRRHEPHVQSDVLPKVEPSMPASGRWPITASMLRGRPPVSGSTDDWPIH